MVEVKRHLTRLTLGGWIALVLTILAGVSVFANLFFDAPYVYGYEGLGSVPVDSLMGFAIGIIFVLLCLLAVRGLVQRNVGPALAALVLMPFVYLLMTSGAAMSLHRLGVLKGSSGLLVWVEIIPAGVMAVIFGAEALRNYRRKFRRFT